MRKINLFLIVGAVIFSTFAYALFTYLDQKQSNIVIITPSKKEVIEYISKEKGMYCDIILYDNDDLYLYTWTLCENFSIHTSGLIDVEEGFSMPIRYQYNLNNGVIEGYETPKDGDLYSESINGLFPKDISDQFDPSNMEITILENNAKLMFLGITADEYKLKLEKFLEEFPEYRNWEDQESFAGKTFMYSLDRDNFYFTFITNGSGVYLADVKCFKVDKDNNVSQITDGKIDLMDGGVDPITCNSY